MYSSSNLCGTSNNFITQATLKHIDDDDDEGESTNDFYINTHLQSAMNLIFSRH